MERRPGTWPKTLWKWVTDPTVDVLAVIALVLVAAWVVVQADVEMRKAFALPYLPMLHLR